MIEKINRAINTIKEINRLIALFLNPDTNNYSINPNMLQKCLQVLH